MQASQPRNVSDFSLYVPEILRKSKLFYVVISSLEGKNMFVNGLYQDRFSYVSDNLIGRASVETIHTEHLERNRVAAHECIQNPGSVVKVILKKAENYLGVHYMTSWEYSLLQDADGSPLGIYCLGYDITDADRLGRRANLLDEKLGRIINELPVGFYSIDHDWKVDKANNSALQLFGFSRESFEGKSIWEVFPESKGYTYPGYFRQAMEGLVPVNFDEYKPDTEQWFAVSVYPSLQGITVYFKDITESKKAELALTQSEAELRRVTDLMNDVVWISDLEFNISYVSPSVTKLTGRSAIEWKESSIADKFLPEMVANISRILQEELENENKPGIEKNRSRLVEGQEIRADGTLMDISVNVSFIRNENGKAVGLHGVSRDITARMNVMRELIRTKELLEQTGRIANVGGYEANFITGEVEWSRVTKLIHEVPEDYVPSIDTAINFYKEGYHRKRIAELVNRAMMRGEAYDEEFQIITAKGRDVWVRAHGTTDFADGKCTKLFGTFEDITLRKKAENEQQSLFKLTQIQNERLRNFAYIVSHNLKSHAGNIQSLIQLLLDNKSEQVALELMQLMQKASEKLMETVGHLAEVALVSTGMQDQMHALNLKTIVDDALNNVSAVAIESEFEISNDVPDTAIVIGLAAYLDSVVLNLLTNAIKYKAPERNGCVKITSKNESDFVVLSVSDNGQGIDLARHGTALFGMYKTFHKHPEAQGVGLYITKNQVEAMGGRIEVESKPGDGATFKVFLRKA